PVASRVPKSYPEPSTSNMAGASVGGGSCEHCNTCRATWQCGSQAAMGAHSTRCPARPVSCPASRGTLAAEEVLKQFFGADQISFQDCGVTLPAGSTGSDPSPVLRSYTSFSPVAVESAYSRILIGFHFRKAVEEGTAYGRKIGERAVNLYLQPVR